MSEELKDVGSFADYPGQAEHASTNASPHEFWKEYKSSDGNSSPESTVSNEKFPTEPTKEFKHEPGTAKKTPEGEKKSPGSTTEKLQVGEVTLEASEVVDSQVELAEAEESLRKEDDIRETCESLEEAEKKTFDEFAAATEHVLSSPSDLSEVVSSFENLQPIYGSEALNFRNDETISLPKEEKDEVADNKLEEKSDLDKKSNKSPKNDKSDGNDDKGDKKGTDWEMKRDRRKSSVLTDADLTRKSSEDPYPIEIPLKKRVNKSTRKKLWREIQKRKPFISATVYAHIQHFAKPPFQTWGCHNGNNNHDFKSYMSENAKRNI